MNIASVNSSIWESATANRGSASTPDAVKAAKDTSEDPAGNDKLREAFQSFVGETLFSQMLKSARKTQNKPAYFHGGRAEEMFQQQLDQVLAEKIAKTDGASYSDAMFELFTMKRS
jgi:peptidoglycan hydrolase FlgJ